MNIFKKIVDLIQSKENNDDSSTLIGDQSKSTDLDYRFARAFTLSGGFFNYCANDAEALQNLSSILKVEHINSIFCCDEDLKSFLDVLKTPYSECIEPQNDAAFISCEYLIAFDGRIMLSFNNIKHFSSSSLPDKIIIMANISQIVENLNDAMMKVKRKGSLKNLTSISCSNSKLDTLEPDNTKLFLLLLED